MMNEHAPPDDLETTFIDAISRGWGLVLNCQPCGVLKKWSDAELAERFILNLDRPMSDLRGRVNCPECRKTISRIYPYNAGAMNWRTASKQLSDMPAIITDHQAELRDRAKEKRDDLERPAGGSYASAKMRS